MTSTITNTDYFKIEHNKKLRLTGKFDEAGEPITEEYKPVQVMMVENCHRAQYKKLKSFVKKGVGR